MITMAWWALCFRGAHCFEEAVLPLGKLILDGRKIGFAQQVDRVRSKNSARLLAQIGSVVELGGPTERSMRKAALDHEKVTEATSEDDHDGLMALCCGGAHAARW